MTQNNAVLQLGTTMLNQNHQNPVLDLAGIAKHYGNTIALDDINLKISSKKIIGLLGPNGCGKTTMFKLINGLLTPTGGTLQVAGQNIGPKTKAIISYLPDVNYLNTWMKVRQLEQMFVDFYADFDRNKFEKIIQTMNINLDSKLATLSKGNKEKVQLALCLSRRAKLYIMDEPIGGVDPAAREYILDLIRDNYVDDSTLLVSTHLVTDIERIFDEVIFLKSGRIIAYDEVDAMREKTSMSINDIFKEVFRGGY